MSSPCQYQDVCANRATDCTQQKYDASCGSLKTVKQAAAEAGVPGARRITPDMFRDTIGGRHLPP